MAIYGVVLTSEKLADNVSLAIIEEYKNRCAF